jgi:hypothetical protein
MSSNRLTFLNAKAAPIAALAMCFAALPLSGCASLVAGSFSSIDLTPEEMAAQPNPAKLKLAREYDLVRTLAAMSGCSTRVAASLPKVAEDAAEEIPTVSDGCSSLLSRKQFIGQLIGADKGWTNLYDMPIAQLVPKAKSGDKAAQLELGIRFEEGLEIERDFKQAKRLYQLSASDSGGPIWVYQPAVGDAPGRSVQISTSPKIYGLSEAKKRLAALKAAP